MKKNIFLVLVGTLLILILIYFYLQKEIIVNKYYIKNGIHIEYPYFNNITIDNYISTYLNNSINKNNYDKIFIDYDYILNDNLVDMSLYTYGEEENIKSVHTKSLEINLDDYSIKEYSDTYQDNKEYSIYSNKIIDKNKKMVALTFDDGPNHNTDKVLNILDKYNVKATFFIIGANIEKNEATIERMYKMGMEVGNHSYSHKLMTKLSANKIKEEVSKTDEKINNIISSSSNLLRPSYGSVNKRIKNNISKPIILWDIDTLDWKYHNSKRITSNILKNVSDGDIILMHDIYSATANSLEETIPKLLSDGYQLVTVTELFYYKDISLINGKTYTSAK